MSLVTAFLPCCLSWDKYNSRIACASQEDLPAELRERVLAARLAAAAAEADRAPPTHSAPRSPGRTHMHPSASAPDLPRWSLNEILTGAHPLLASMPKLANLLHAYCDDIACYFVTLLSCIAVAG